MVPVARPQNDPLKEIVLYNIEKHDQQTPATKKNNQKQHLNNKKRAH